MWALKMRKICYVDVAKIIINANVQIDKYVVFTFFIRIVFVSLLLSDYFCTFAPAKKVIIKVGKDYGKESTFDDSRRMGNR